MHRLLLPLALAALWAAPARAETVFAGPVSDARLALAADGSPFVAYVSGGALSIARRDGGTWPATTVSLPGTDIEIDGLSISNDGEPTALVRDRGGSWLGVVTKSRLHLIRPDSIGDLIGPAGLALDGRGRAVVAYALWRPSHDTYLRLVREDARGRLVTSRITRGGFPATPTLAAAAPLVLPSGQVRVVETYLPAAIEWRPIPGDWLGQFLHGSALGIPTGRVAAAANGSTVFAAWTEAFPTLGLPTVVLAVHARHTFSGVVLENATFAALAVTSHGAELAANRCIADHVCGALVAGTELDGIVADYAAEATGGRQVLLDETGELDWFRAPAPLAVHLTLTGVGGQLAGHVGGASGGTVLVYRELAGGSRSLIATVPVAADGTFTATDASAGPVAPAAYRAVYVDPATSLPYAVLFPQPTP
ncbi:MAG: hypothetical protein ACYDA3_00045 [Gaiellaceae bacterium]